MDELLDGKNFPLERLPVESGLKPGFYASMSLVLVPCMLLNTLVLTGCSNIL